MGMASGLLRSQHLHRMHPGRAPRRRKWRQTGGPRRVGCLGMLALPRGTTTRRWLRTGRGARLAEVLGPSGSDLFFP